MNKEENKHIIFEVINNNGDIKLTKLRNPQALWQDKDYPDEYVFKDVNYVNIFNLIQENQKYKEVIDKAINNSQYWIDYYTRLNSDERIALRLQENIDILKEVE